ncbi:MAG: hypothetical protein ATN35_00145 [Epulopiscium sp. Nele67-Bin004]|nr:MAG: hypothetical protein ATN35_00145 [Epulopiscium sp. Nele67-Bin004]
MIRGILVVLFMCWHYIINTNGRRKYRVDDKELDTQQKKIYGEKIYRIMQSFSRGVVKASGSKVIIKGEENLEGVGGGVLYMSNHLGFFDAPVTAMVIDDPLIYIGKDDIKKMPIVSTWFEAIGSIYMDRDDIRKSMLSIQKGIEELKAGQSVIVFPEGTRSKDGNVGEFKAGTFKLATKSKCSIVPIAIKNTELIFEKNGKKIKPATVFVNIGKPVHLSDLSKEEIKNLPKYIEDYVKELLQEI